jgi:hypothetical protein
MDEKSSEVFSALIFFQPFGETYLYPLYIGAPCKVTNFTTFLEMMMMAFIANCYYGCYLMAPECYFDKKDS